MIPIKIEALRLIEKFQNTQGKGHTLGLKAAKRYAIICVEEICNHAANPDYGYYNELKVQIERC